MLYKSSLNLRIVIYKEKSCDKLSFFQLWVDKNQKTLEKKYQMKKGEALFLFF